MRCSKLSRYVVKLWEKSIDFSRFSLAEQLCLRVCFILLCLFEFFYTIGFFLVMRMKKQGVRSFCKVISVGNLSVGGTGKSVVVSFLYKKLAQPLPFVPSDPPKPWRRGIVSRDGSRVPKSGAIFLRGYGRTQRRKDSIVVTDDSPPFVPRNWSRASRVSSEALAKGDVSREGSRS